MKRKLYTLGVMIIILTISANTAFGLSSDVVWEKSKTMDGYSYCADINNPEKIEDLKTTINLNLIKDQLIGEIFIPIQGKQMKIEYTAKQDKDNPTIYYGNADNMKDVGIVIKYADSQIEQLSLCNGCTAYNFGSITYDQLMNKAVDFNNNMATNNITTRSSDAAVIGEDYNTKFLAQVTLPPNMDVDDDEWMATRLFTRNTSYLTHIYRVEFNGSKSGSAYDLLYVRPSGTYSNPTTLVEYAFYYAINRYLSVSLPTDTWTGSCGTSTWNHEYTMWEDWDDHVYTSDTTQNGILSDVRVERLTSNEAYGDVDIDIWFWMSGAGYFSDDITVDYLT